MYVQIPFIDALSTLELALRGDKNGLIVNETLYVADAYAGEFAADITAAVYARIASLLNLAPGNLAIVYNPTNGAYTAATLTPDEAASLRERLSIPEFSPLEEALEAFERVSGPAPDGGSDAGTGQNYALSSDVVVKTVEGSLPLGEAFPNLTPDETAVLLAFVADHPEEVLPSRNSNAFRKIMAGTQAS